MNAKMELKK